MITFQKLIFVLQKYWSNVGSNIVQAFDIEVGAATFHPITFFNFFNDKKIFYSYVQLCRRPSDSHMNINNDKLQQYYQFQVIIKPSVSNLQELFLNSLRYIGIDFNVCELRFIEDNWNNPTLGAYGVGWEIWLDGMEITQFTYLKQMAGIHCKYIFAEITYGLERLSLYLQKKNSIYDIIWDENDFFGVLKYGDIFLGNELEKSNYNLQSSDINFLFSSFNSYESQSKKLLSFDNFFLNQSYEFVVKMVNCFNLLDSRNCLSDIKRQNLILRTRNLFNRIASLYLFNNKI